MERLKLLLFSTLLLICHGNLIAQESPLSANYVGLIPSVLVEPYDTVDAVEINFFPFLYEFRMGTNNDLGFQIRPILNYRFLKAQNGFSQIGGTMVINKYFLKVFDDNFWLKPQLGIYYTYAYNRLDKVNTMTLGIEPGAFMKISENFSLSVNLQPGINYYPDKFSQEFVDSENGFKGHLGIIFHVGYNF
jgi:hypothetical protein